MASWIVSNDTNIRAISAEVRTDSRFFGSSVVKELSMELYRRLNLLDPRLAMLTDPVTLSTTGDGGPFFLPTAQCTSDQKPWLRS